MAQMTGVPRNHPVAVALAVAAAGHYPKAADLNVIARIYSQDAADAVIDAAADIVLAYKTGDHGGARKLAAEQTFKIAADLAMPETTDPGDATDDPAELAQIVKNDPRGGR
jgi:hypothetical protein